LSRRGVFRAATVFVALMVATVGVLSLWSPDWWQRLIYPLEYRATIADSAGRNRIDPYLVAAVIYVESGFDPASRSRAGARGLMQLLPSTAREAAQQLGDTDFNVDQLDDPQVNVRYGTWYLRQLVRKYHSTTFALAAYNGGGGNMDKWLRGRQADRERDVIADIPFRETREFVARVQKTEDVYRRLYPKAFK